MKKNAKFPTNVRNYSKFRETCEYAKFLENFKSAKFFEVFENSQKSA